MNFKVSASLRGYAFISVYSLAVLVSVFLYPQGARGEANWVTMAVSHQPPPRSNPGFVYNTQEERFMVFGGRTWNYFPPLNVNNDSWFNDGWFFKDGTWSKMDYGLAFDSFGPYPAQYRGRFVWNPIDNEVLLSGGSFFRNFGYTAVYKNGQFLERHPTNGPPAFLEGGFFNPSDGCYYFVDNVADVHRYDGTDWSNLHPGGIPPDGHLIFGGATSYNPESRQFIYFGGARFPENTLLERTYIYSVPHNEWRMILSNSNPPPSLYPGMVYHPDRGRHVLCGGLTAEGVSTEVWEYNEARYEWTQIAVANPRGFSDHAIAFHPMDRKIYVFGGWRGILGLSSDLQYLDNLPVVASEIVTPTPLNTATPSATASGTSTLTQTPSLTFTPSLTSTPSFTATASVTHTTTPSYTQTATATLTPSSIPPTISPTPTRTPLFGDLDLSGKVGSEDLILLLQQWGISATE
jgi:hypothetical protein